ncbi:ABC-type spermidine/putrescine transport system permease subunit I, partial [Sporolactobacillus spathodeae]|nr:ABC-type spermidine/putrescine transport system permease subunit I [Sporolactobacillus spathodeae]
MRQNILFILLQGQLTLGNYAHFFTSIYLRMALASLGYAFLITLFTLLVAYPTAYVLTLLKHSQLWLLLLILPTWINVLLKAYAYIGLFGTFGPVNALFHAIGIGRQQILLEPDIDRVGAGIDRVGAGIDRVGAGIDRVGAGIDRVGAGIDRV